MTEFREEELLNTPGLEWTGKYKEKNPISKFLIDGFYRGLQKIVPAFGTEDSILEVGCGAGLSSLRIQKMLAGQHFEVSDFDPEVIRAFEQTRFPIPYRHESVLALERGDGTFDVMILLEVLEHLENFEKALREIFRVSRKYVVISTPNEPLWRVLNIARGKYWKNLGNTPGHINHWSPRALQTLVAQHGKILQVQRPLPWTIILAEKQ
jgi:2-polyprenyl-3-methyl-5-hydroxy-6-metoxy-1,4-benzoquinol methylase